MDLVQWKLDSDGVLTISGSGAMADYNAGAAPWYSHYASITGVVIENGVTSIGNYAFYGCRNLIDINIPYGVSSIGEYAFGSSGIKDVVLPQSVTSIGSRAFYASGLEDITIPDSVTRIENYTFEYCRSLKNVRLPDGITSVGSSAFYEAPGPSQMNYWFRVGSNTSTAIRPYGAYFVDPDYPEYKIMQTAADNGGYTITIMDYLGTDTQIVVPDVIRDYAVTAIGSSVFHRCSDVTSITIPDGVSSIGSYAFYGCSSLENVNIPSGVTQIEYCAFENCSSLTEIDLPDGVRSIGTSAFAGCSSLMEIDLPADLVDIGAKAFQNCIGVTQVTIPANVNTLGEKAFYSCSSLADIYLPDGITSLGNSPFPNNTAIWCNPGTDTAGLISQKNYSFIDPDYPVYKLYTM